MKRILGALAVLVSLCLVASCSSAGGGVEGTAVESAGRTGDTRVAREGGAARIIQPIDAASLDPLTVINSPSTGAASLNALYDVLFTVDGDGSVVPQLAAGFSSPDGVTWTMELREGVTFTDGTPLDAEAVRAHWERIRTSPAASGWATFQSLAALNMPDPLTFEVVLKAPNRQFHQFLLHTSALWIPSPAAVQAKGAGFGEAPVGAGPFMFESRTPNAETVLVRNPGYHEQGLPKLDSITFVTVLEPQQAIDTLLSGAAQGAVSMTDQNALTARGDGYTIIGTEQVGASSWLFGTRRPPFDDVRARKAVYLAMDMEALNQEFLGGAAVVPDTFFPESSPFHNPDIRFPEHDPVEAQRLLDELAAEGRPVSFEIISPGGDSGLRAVFVQTQLSTYDNLEVRVRNVDPSTYGISLYSGDFDMATFGFPGVDPEPSVARFQSDWHVPIASLDSPAVDAAIFEGRNATSSEERKAAYDTLTTELNELYPVKWMNRDFAWLIAAPDMTGATTYGSGSPLWANFGYAT